MTTYWTSYNTREGPSFLPEDGRTLMISVVLDAGAQCDFNGIRVMVVQPENEGTEMSLTEITNPARSRSGHTTSANYRTTLTSLRSSRDKFSGHDIDVSGQKKLCTIVFELQPFQTYWGHFARLVLISHTPQPSIRVVHNHVEHMVSSALFFLHCSHSSQPEFSPGGSIRKPTRVCGHFVRILPVSKNRPPWPTFNLPPSILSHIILFAFSDKQKGWRKGLLSCSLVCKSWENLVDLFFDDFDDTSRSTVDHDPADISTVARSLRTHAARGALIKSYSPSKYLRLTRVTNVAFMAFCEAQNTILRLAPSVTDLTLESTHAVLFQDFFDILCGLREVQTLRVTRSHLSPAAGAVRNLSFEDILKIISLWPNLKKLRMINWKASPDLDCSSGGAENTQSACRLENLHLNIGKIAGSSLLLLVGPANTPSSLRIARFEGVKGLTNSDFLAFLTRVAPTLISLSVTACPMPRFSDKEEYAIDAAMPNMISLEALVIDGDLSSAKALSRKVQRRICEDDKGTRMHRISLNNPPMISLDHVLNAMSVTGWESIYFYLDSSMGYSPRSSAEVAQAAKARGIDFRVSISPRELYSEDVH